MTTSTDIPRKSKTKGTAFLIEESAPQDVFTPEDLSEEHLAIGRMVDEFWANEVEPMRVPTAAFRAMSWQPVFSDSCLLTPNVITSYMGYPPPPYLLES